MRQTMGIEVAAAASESRSDEITAPAVLALDETRTARISARAEGTIAHTFHQVGDRVAANTNLAELHSHTGHDLLALYRNALTDRRQKTRELTYATEVEARTARLLADHAASRQDLERAEASRVAAEQQLAMAETEAQRAQHDLEFFGIEANETSSMDVSMPVTTPIAGTIIERAVTVGTTVTAATPLFVVSDLSRLWALAEVDEGRLGALAQAQSVALTVSAYGAEEFTGRVAAIGATVDPTTRRVVVRIDIPNPKGRLKPNMFASVVLSTGVARDRVVVPTGAVQQLQRGQVVFVEEADGAFRAVRVEVGLERDGRVEVLSGIAAGQRVAVEGTFLLKSELQKAILSEEG
jgi:cobalt-zinc-cadmium efflux system membrane fusion protein